MRREPHVLFDNGTHQCLLFDDLVRGEGVQTNQFLITDHGQYLLLDPGGDLTYTPLSLELSKRISLQERLSLRGFDAAGMMVDALLSEPGEADAGLRKLFADPRIVEVDAHNAVRGCFAARARRA